MSGVNTFKESNTTELVNQLTLNYLSKSEVNCVFSGYSFLCLLEMLLKGATNDIAKEILSVTKGKTYLKLAQNNSTLNNQCVLYHNDQIKLTDQYYKYTTDANIGVGTIDVNNLSQCIDQVNKKVASFTNNLIPRLLNASDYDQSFKLVLMNMINFKAMWSQDFDPYDTIETNFITDSKEEGNNEEKKVQMMNQYNEYFSYFENDSCQYLLLPCKDSSYGMMLCLPGTIRTPLANCTVDLINIMQNLQRKKISRLGLPKFEIECDIDLKPLCESLGITTMFENTNQLKNMINEENLTVSQIKQKCIIKVHEKGAEAAAVSYAEVMASCCAPGYNIEKPINFVADHPFSYQLFDTNTGIILFAGNFYNNCNKKRKFEK